VSRRVFVHREQRDSPVHDIKGIKLLLYSISTLLKKKEVTKNQDSVMWNIFFVMQFWLYITFCNLYSFI